MKRILLILAIFIISTASYGNSLVLTKDFNDKLILEKKPQIINEKITTVSVSTLSYLKYACTATFNIHIYVGSQYVGTVSGTSTFTLDEYMPGMCYFAMQEAEAKAWERYYEFINLEE